MQLAIASLEKCLKESAASIGNGTDSSAAETLNSLKLILDFQPKDRHRFVMPSQTNDATHNVERISKLFATQEAWSAFRKSYESLVNAIEFAVSSAESKQDWESGYRLRWQLAGLQAILQSSKQSRPDLKVSWSHSEAIVSPAERRKAFVNHPKMRWPAGAYSIVTTPHFEIASQSDTKATMEVATYCELVFAIWKQMFFQVWANDQISAPEYTKALDHKFSIVLFRDREAYTKALRSVQANIAISTGYYDPNRKVAFFYWDGIKTQSTVYHELTHQFFYEANKYPVALDTNRGLGFWVVEGVALYMESISTRSCGGGLIADVGGWDSPRLQAGRYRRLHDKYWVPWDEFRAADGIRFRRELDIKAWYSQATGLAHLSMDGNPARRQAFASYIESVYAGNENPELMGDWNIDEKLRDAYDRYLIGVPAEMPTRPFFHNRRDAVLSRCRTTTKQLLEWPVEYRTAPWLDLSFTQIDDQLFVTDDVPVKPLWNIQRLNLESTNVTDLSLLAISEGKSLVELDLSNCRITDLGVAALRDHKSLKTLWLNHCEVTDRSIEILLTIPQLESVHLMKTKVSSEAWERLVTAKPRLKSKSTRP